MPIEYEETPEFEGWFEQNVGCIEASHTDLRVLAEASDRIPTYCAANSLLVAGRRSELSEKLGVGMDKQIPFQCEPDGNFWIGVRNALVIMGGAAFLAWLIARIV